MKKKLFLILCILAFQSYSTFTLIGPYRLPKKEYKIIPSPISPKIIINAGPTLSWWRCPKNIILDVGRNKDVIKNNQSAPIPGFSFSLKRKFFQSERPTAVYIGAKVHFAKHNNAIKTDYFDDDEPQASLEIHQDIKSIRIAPFAEWLVQQTRFSLSVWIAPTIGIRGVEQFRWWEKSTKSYTGQSLKPYTQHAAGEFGTTLLFGGKRNRLFSFGYSFFLGNITFKKRVFISTPDPNASDIFHDQLLLEDVDSIYLPVEPKIRLHAHTVRFGFAISF